jgi:hypothetical protein
MLDIHCQLDRHHDDDTGVGRNLHQIEANPVGVDPADIIRASNRVDSDQHADDSLEQAQQLPGEEICLSEYPILLANMVHLGVVGVEHLLAVPAVTQLVEGLFRRLQLEVDFEDCPQDHGEEGEDHVEEGDGPGQPKGFTAPHAVKAEDHLDDCKHHVLVEEVQHHFRDPDVVEPTIEEEEFPQQAELSDGVVGDLGCPRALLAEDSHAHVGLHDHVDVVGAISHRQRALVHALDQPHHLRLLPRSHSAEHRRTRLGNDQHQVDLVLGETDAGTIDDWTHHYWLHAVLQMVDIVDERV